MSALSQRTGITVPGAPAVLRSVLDRGIVRGKLCITECWNASSLLFLSQPPPKRGEDILWTLQGRETHNAGSSTPRCRYRFSNGCLLSQVVTPYTEYR